jgi:hypothetical protein
MVWSPGAVTIRSLPFPVVMPLSPVSLITISPLPFCKARQTERIRCSEQVGEMDLMSAGDDVDELASGVLALIEEVSHVAVLPARALRPSPARLSIRRWAANGSWDQAPNPVLKEQAIKLPLIREDRERHAREGLILALGVAAAMTEDAARG